ncbi:putative Rve domain-containing protein [Cocos nucifera]|uniref:Putative Rve domain-containing protein n=1 Tax=Cocos nucifera TaxID=13894 RepID=A0A8K0MU16_COCNU|nr:putative Rve domain-containing protein [Cocos nucifera]
MQRDAADLMIMCDQCQRISNIQRRPSTPLAPITTPWPFAQWGMDILRAFSIAVT